MKPLPGRSGRSCLSGSFSAAFGVSQHRPLLGLCPSSPCSGMPTSLTGWLTSTLVDPCISLWPSLLGRAGASHGLLGMTLPASAIHGLPCFLGAAHEGSYLTRPDGWCRNDKALEEPPGENPLGQRAGGCSRALDCRFSRQQAQYTYCAVNVKRSETMQITAKRCICTLWRIFKHP